MGLGSGIRKKPIPDPQHWLFKSNVAEFTISDPGQKGTRSQILQHWIDQEFEYSLRVLTAKRIAERFSVTVHLQWIVQILF